ncbi:MAG: two-component system, OmpR family, response regulator [Actinomycetota bacterium]|nr:two-component system, OmpR family, response regulator [Actinomycetota bacterium]
MPRNRGTNGPWTAGTSGPVGPRDAVLVVEDDPAIAELLRHALRLAGFDAECVPGCRQALRAAAETDLLLAILDVRLPDGSGFDLCRLLRQERPDLGVIFLTARDALDDKLTGLALGGDDYITKPFSVVEVVARAQAVLRRTVPARRSAPLRVADLELDDETHRVLRAGDRIELSPTEFRLLRFLLENTDRVLSREQILRQVWQYDYAGGAAVVEKFVSQLRRKIDATGEPLLHTVRGFGYVLREPEP